MLDRTARVAPVVVLAAALLVAPAAWAQSMFHTPPVAAEAHAALRVEGLLVGGKKMARVVLRYRRPGEAYAEAKMALRYGDLYRAEIPGSVVEPPALEYFVEGVSRDGQRLPLFMSEEAPVRVPVSGPPPASPQVASASAPPPPATPPPPPASPAPTPDDLADEDGQRGLAAPQPTGTISELAEELAIYAAEDTSANIGRHTKEEREAPASSTVISQAELRALGARTVADVLDVLPGLTVSRDTGGFFRVAVRGLRSDPEVLFLLDGHPLNASYDGRALWTLSVENLARIEVVRGPGPARYPGFLAVVNLVTDRSEGVRLAASGSPVLAASGHLSAARQMGELRVHGSVDVLRDASAPHDVPNDSFAAEWTTQGYREDASKPVGQSRDERLLLDAGAGLTWSSKGGGELSATARFLGEQRSALVGLFDALGPDSSLGWRTLLLDLRYEKELSPAFTLRALAHGDEQSTSRLYQISPSTGTYWAGGAVIPGYCSTSINYGDTCPSGYLFSGGLREDQYAGALGGSAALEAELSPVPANRLTLGLGADYHTLYQRQVLINYAPDDLRHLVTATGQDAFEPVDSGLGAAERLFLSRLSLGAYANDVWTLVEPLTISLGVRADAVRLPKVTAGVIAGTQFVPSVEPRVSVAYKPSPGLLLTLAYARGFRVPTVEELVPFVAASNVNGGRFTGNPGLLPATVDSVDLGADLVQNAGDARVRLRGSAFFEYFSNPIALADISGNIIPIRNRLGVRVFGAEGDARVEITERARTWVAASWFRAEDMEARDPLKLLTDTPQWRVNAGVSMPVGDLLNLDIVLRTGAERRNPARTPLENLRRWRIPSYALVDAQLRTEPLFGGCELSLSVRDAFAHDHYDDAYRMDRITGGVPREGLSAYLMLRASY